MKQRIILLISTIIIALLLCACGGDAPQECGEYTLAAARVQGESVRVESVSPEGGALKLLPGGKGRVELGADSGSVRWQLDGENITVTAGSASYEGSLKDGVMRLSFPARAAGSSYGMRTALPKSRWRLSPCALTGRRP